MECKRNEYPNVAKLMQTPKRSGPNTPEEIDSGSQKKDPNATSDGNGSVTPNSCDGQLCKFLSTGRSGRRNAITDMLACHAEPGLVDLPDRFEDLSVNIDQSNAGVQDPNAPSTSKQQG
ncbi:uncharacterized protein LOC116427577 [Nomia melanderi]|uniref:uncharacterized protein LOC116427577 n=1 Tax=Nomia melanderi TaxID=2448451 RepID=UPI0013042745|nr:uncharacterized protein LOC116427577 [Nomia melanderi]